MAGNLSLPRGPPLLQFPKGMLRPKRVFKKQERYSSVILLKFPAEVLLIVLKHCGLTVYDRASLALTCRMMALIISAEPDMLTLTQELAHGLEEQILEVFLECSSPEFNATAEEIDHWAEERKKLSHDYHSRCDPDAARKFMLRLDEGWNTSESSYCGNCDKFVSTDEQYWIQKDIAFTYKSDSEIARAWRRGQCTHYERIVMGEDARKSSSGSTVAIALSIGDPVVAIGDQDEISISSAFQINLHSIGLIASQSQRTIRLGLQAMQHSDHGNKLVPSL